MVKLDDNRLDVNYSIVNPENVLFDDWSTIVFGYFWRSLVIAILSGIVGYIVTIVVIIIFTLILSILGFEVSKDALFFSLIHIFVSLMIYFPLNWRFLKWILSSNFGEYKFILLKKDRINIKK